MSADELERLRAGLAQRGIRVAGDEPGAVVDAALAAIDRRNLTSGRQVHISPPAPPDVRIVPVPYDPRTGRMLA